MMHPKDKPLRLKGKAYAALRAQVYERDGGKCQACGLLTSDDYPDWHDRRYHLAHKLAKRINGDGLLNVRVLCGGCHRKEHNAGGKPCPKKEQVS